MTRRAHRADVWAAPQGRCDGRGTRLHAPKGRRARTGARMIRCAVQRWRVVSKAGCVEGGAMHRGPQTQETVRRAPQQVERRRAEEAAMVSEMIALWCWKHHGGAGSTPGWGPGADSAPVFGPGSNAALCTAAHGSAAEPRLDAGGAIASGDRIDSVPSSTPVRLGRRNIYLCPECERLRTYALARIARCPHMATKTFCSVCPTPCYRPQMREQIRTVMRWAGPRMLRYRPWQALRHAWITLRAKRSGSR